MKGKLTKVLALIIAFAMFLPAGLTLAIDNDAPDLIAKTQILEDAPEEKNLLELSELNDEFDPNGFETQDGLAVSPLDIEVQKSPYAVRSHYPSKFDLREYNMVTPVRDQGPNGSCWAFAAYGSMESILLRQKKGKYDFSEKHMRNKHGFDWSLDKGGNRDMATAYLASGKGPILEDDDPYDPVISVSKDGLLRAMDIDKVIYLPDVTSRDEVDNLKWAISEYGGVYTTINSSKYYENHKNYTMYNPGSGKADHAVTIVGWDDNFPNTLFTQRPPGHGAWICKNSWGGSYMDAGYYYVSYYDGFVGRSPAVFIPKKKDLRGIIHQYDPLGATRSVGFAGEGYMANIFTAKYKELLHEVGLFNVSNQCDYEIYLVRNIKSTSQLSEQRIELAKGNLMYPGYYTIKVDPVQLDEGEQFAIVVYMNSKRSKNNTPLPIESNIKGYTSKAVAMPGQSYYSSKGDGWTDLTSSLANANFCVKAITTTGDHVPERELDEIDDHNSGIEIDDGVKIRKLYFEMGSQGYISTDKKGLLSYKVEPSDAKVELEFGSMDESVAVFKEGGILYPVLPGNTNVYVKTKGGEMVARFNVQVVNPLIRVPGRNPIPTIGENDYVPPEPEPDPEPEVPDDYVPDPIRPERDPDVVLTLFMKVQSALIQEGEVYDIENRVGVFPETAKRAFVYYSDRPDIVEARPDGKLVALKQGRAKITVMTENKLSTTFMVTVVPDRSKQEIKIEEFTNTRRRGGVFRVKARVTLNGQPYNGPGTITVRSDDRVKKQRVYFNAGYAEVKHTGFSFGVWRKEFEATLEVRDKKEEIKFGY